MKAKMDTVEDWMTAMKATADANGYWLNRLWPAFYGAAGLPSRSPLYTPTMS